MDYSKVKCPLCLVPGWASDYRIFEPLDLGYECIYPADFSPFNFAKSLLDLLEEKRIEKVSLLGWSLGGFVAVDFATLYPNLVDELILIGIRNKYKSEDIDIARESLEKNKEAYLYKFYTQCFHKKETNLIRDYCSKWNLNKLLESLEYLENKPINKDTLGKVDKVKIIHGENDQIACAEEAKKLADSIKRADFMLVKDAGHALFLETELGEILNG